MVNLLTWVFFSLLRDDILLCKYNLNTKVYWKYRINGLCGSQTQKQTAHTHTHRDIPEPFAINALKQLTELDS